MSIIHKFNNLDTLYNNDKFILSALNLAFVGYFTKNKIQINNHYYSRSAIYDFLLVKSILKWSKLYHRL